MKINVDSAQLWVSDQDEALAFYTEKLGMEVRSDVTLPEMGGFRTAARGPISSWAATAAIEFAPATARPTLCVAARVPI